MVTVGVMHHTEMAKLNAQAHELRHHGYHEEARALEEEREQLRDAILEEVLTELEAEGLPQAWRPKPKN